MRFAVDNNGRRIEPFKGGRALCQLCNATLIAKCGDIYTWHWQHKNDGNCDAWKEHETEWHRQWKAKFPIDNQEVILEENGEKHIADVLTNNNLVIEFQNSSISTSTIIEREDFYKDMIWVINAINFKDNFRIRSAVTASVREINNEEKYSLNDMHFNLNEELKQLDKSINEKLNKISIAESNKNHHLKILNNLKTSDKDKLFNEIITLWQEGSFCWSGSMEYKTDDLQNKYRDKYIDLYKQKKWVEEDKIEVENTLISINDLNNFTYNEIVYKIVSFNHINDNNYTRAIAIEKTSINTFFPNVINFGTPYSYQSYQYKQETYYFGIDPRLTIDNLIKKQTKVICELNSIVKEIDLMEIDIKNYLEETLTSQIQKEKDNYTVFNTEVSELSKTKEQLVERKKRRELSIEKEKSELKIEIEKSYKKQRFDIMKKKKGFYFFNWKHERKTWRISRVSLFFDFGDNILFEKIEDNKFKKINTQDFLTRFS